MSCVQANAQYVHLSGEEVSGLVVGRAIGMPSYPTVFRKDGHLGSPSGQVSKSTYRILPDGQICFSGGATIVGRFNGGQGSMNLGTCIRIVRSSIHYIALAPDSGRDLFMLNVGK